MTRQASRISARKNGLLIFLADFLVIGTVKMDKNAEIGNRQQYDKIHIDYLIKQLHKPHPFSGGRGFRLRPRVGHFTERIHCTI